MVSDVVVQVGVQRSAIVLQLVEVECLEEVLLDERLVEAKVLASLEAVILIQIRMVTL